MNIDNMVINRPVRATLFDKSTNEVLFSADQLTDCSLECSGEQVFTNDALGQKIAAFDRSKDATFSASNSIINFGLMGAQFGSDKELASETNKLIVPCFELIEVGTEATKITLAETPATALKHIYATNSDKSKSTMYDVATDASATEFAINGKVITLPTGAFKAGDRVAVWYDKESSEAQIIKNTTTNYAKGGRFVLEVLVCDVCDVNTEYYAYLIFENSKLDNNVTITMSNEATHPFAINALQDYCSTDNELFKFIIAA